MENLEYIFPQDLKMWAKSAGRKFSEAQDKIKALSTKNISASAYWDENSNEWQENCSGTVDRNEVQENEAAVYLLLDFWSSEVQENNLDHFHWINEVGYLSSAAIAAISRKVWK